MSEDEEKEEKSLHEEYVEMEEDERGLQRQLHEVEFYAKNQRNIGKTQTASTVVGGVLFIAGLIAIPCLSAVLCVRRGWNGFVGFVVGFMAAILLGAIVSKVYRMIALHRVQKDKNATETTGVVVASSLLSSHIFATGSRVSSHKKVLRATYKVKLRVGDRITIAYSKNRSYNEGEEVKIMFNPKKPRHCRIAQASNKEE